MRIKAIVIGTVAMMLVPSAAFASPLEMSVDEGLAAQATAKGIVAMDACGGHAFIAKQEAELDQFFATHVQSGRQAKGEIEGMAALDFSMMVSRNGGKEKICPQIIAQKALALNAVNKGLEALRVAHSKATHR